LKWGQIKNIQAIALEVEWNRLAGIPALTFPGLKLCNNKSICVTGTIKEYKGKAEIIVNKQEQIKVE